METPTGNPDAQRFDALLRALSSDEYKLLAQRICERCGSEFGLFVDVECLCPECELILTVVRMTAGQRPS